MAGNRSAGALQLALLRRTPRRALTRALGVAAGWRWPAPLARAAVRAFARHYAVDLEEAEAPLAAYPHLRAFFTRALRPGARPIAPGERVPVSPVDGVLSAAGTSEGGQLLQVKGIAYGLEALLVDAPLARAVSGGPWATLYLSPQDYHRVHAPLAGTLSALTYVPGDFWPVNPTSVSGVAGLFTINERLVFDFETALGRCALVMVGATVVGRLRATVGGRAPFTARPRHIARESFAAGPVFDKGEQLGIFDMGSTVIVCLPPGAPPFSAVAVGQAVRVGIPLAAAAG